MSKSKRCIVSLFALVLCLAIATVFVFAFAGCEEESASGEIVNGGDEYKLEENVREKIKISEEPDENGIVQWEYFYKYCYECDDWFGCQGHYRYRTSDGAMYSFYPVKVPMTLTDENGDICSDIQVSLIFEEEPYIYEDGENIYIQARPSFIEIVSLTGESLENATTANDPWDDVTFKMLQHVDFSNRNSLRADTTKEGWNANLLDGYYMTEPQSYSVSDTTMVYNVNMYRDDGYYIFYYTDSDGVVYTFDFYTIVDSVIWDAVVDGNGDIDWRGDDD